MERANETIRVSKLHILVHPGMLVDMLPTDESEEEKERVLKLGNELLKKYIEKALTLASDEILMLYEHGFSKGRAKFFQEFFDQISSILGDRLIVIPDNFVFYDNNTHQYDCTDMYEELEFLAEERGFSLDERVLSEAFGETFGYCVENTANFLNIAGGFVYKTVINLDLTDVFESNEQEILALVDVIRRNLRDMDYSRLIFTMKGKTIDPSNM